MREVAGVGYLAIGVEDPDLWREFLSLFGVAEAGDPKGLRYRVDERSWRIALEPSNPGTVTTGLEVVDARALERVASRLAQLGYPIVEAPELAAKRGVLAAVATADPDGHPFELFCGATVAQTPFVSPTGARFVTGAQGLGHVVYVVSDLAAAESFYFDGLGASASDEMRNGPMRGHFTHFSGRHHTIAFMQAPPAIPVGFAHLMLEVDDLDVVGRAHDAAIDSSFTVRLSLGRHANDRMVSFYTVSPENFALEYGWGGRTIGDNWSAVVYDTGTAWGHERLIPADG